MIYKPYYNSKTTLFKVGDKVRISKDLDLADGGSIPFGVNHYMVAKKGQVVTILAVANRNCSYYDGDAIPYYSVSGSTWYWSAEMFVPLDDDSNYVSLYDIKRGVAGV